MKRRIRYPGVRYQMGTDIFGVPLDVGNIIASGEKGIQTNFLSQVGQSQVVQSAVAATGQQAAADTLAQNLIKYKVPLSIAAAVILTLLIVRR